MCIDCVFSGHVCRRGLCEGAAQSFFRSAKGTVWPLCSACAEQHKRVSVRLAKKGKLAVMPLAGAMFDIPLDDLETLATWRDQDPETVSSIVQAVDDSVKD